MKIKIFFSIFVFLCFFSVAFAHEGSHIKPFLVDMNDTEGFIPDTIEIYQGDSVTFRNTGESQHWPASDIHPTHQSYPDSGIQKCGIGEIPYIFDACKGLEPDEEYTFLFEHAGEWKIHDHVFPSFSGTILVHEDSDYAPVQKPFVLRLRFFINNLILRLKIFFTRTFRAHAIEEEFNKQDIFTVTRDESQLRYWMELAGPEKMMEKLVQDSNGGSELDCHTEAHYTGRMAYELFGSKLFQMGDPACHSGFYHGGMEEFLREEGTDNLAQKINGICALFPTSFGIFECLHGVGHGIMAYEQYDMPAALKLCGELEDSFSQSSCFGGVFMENIIAGQGGGALKGHKTKWVSDDPYFPCNALDQDADVQFQCYQIQTSWMLTLAGYDFSVVAQQCLHAPKDMIAVCFQSLGRDIAGFTLRDPLRIKELCALAPQEYSSRCIYGAVNVIVDFWGAGLTDQASKLCALLDGGDKEECWLVLAGRLFDIFNDPLQAENICSTFEPSYQHLCLR